MQQVNQTLDRLDALQCTLDILQPLFSPRQPKSLVEKSFGLMTPSQQLQAYQKIQIISVSNVELAMVFSCHIGEANNLLPQAYIDVWVTDALAVYDNQGLYPAALVFKDFSAFKTRQDKQQYACSVEEVKPRLDVFVRGLIGRSLSIKPSTGKVYTDTDFIYLPKIISKYQDKEKNTSLYKAMTCFLWAQNWYGTFKRNDYSDHTTQEKLASYKNQEQANALFLRLENIRLLSSISRDFPGLYREINQAFPLNIPNDITWKVVIKRLQKSNADVNDSFKALDVLIKKQIPTGSDYLGDLLFDEVSRVSRERKTKITKDINTLLDDKTDKNLVQQAVDDFNMSDIEEIAEGKTSSPLLNDEYHENENILSELLKDLKQDVNKLSLADLDFRDEKGDNNNGQDKEAMSGDISRETSHQTRLVLPEWDYIRQNYRKGWCQINEKTVNDTETNFKRKTLKRYPYVSQKIRQLFEVMRDQPMNVNRQTSGDEIDIDAVVDMQTALKTQEELTERLYIQRLQQKRQVSVCLLVDMSGSTKGWINLAMRESLILFCDALNILGDAYSLYGFSGLTRQRCDIYCIKTFQDKTTKTVENKIANIQAKDYTRMGFAVRYATQQMVQHPSKHQILLLLCDGKPDDYDGYQGEYGIQDTRKAILEAQGLGIKPFSLTIDKQAQQYLPRLFGPGNYTILNDVSKLPLKLSEIYRKLST